MVPHRVKGARSLVAEEADRKERKGKGKGKDDGDAGHPRALLFWVSACSLFSSLALSRTGYSVLAKRPSFWYLSKPRGGKAPKVGRWHGDTGVPLRTFRPH